MRAVPPGPGEGTPEPGEAEDSRGGGERVDVEAAWAQIVAQWDAAPPPVGAWPVQEDVEPEAPGQEGGAPAGQEPRAPHPGGSTRAAAGPTPAGADEDRWVPPEPPPLLRGGWRAVLPWVGVLGSPAFFLVVVLAHLVLPGAVLLVAVLAFVAGFVALVLRLPASREDDGDDGAVV